MPPPTLRLSTAALRPVLAPFLLHLDRAKPIGDAILAFDGTHLRLELGGLGGLVPATGTWPGQARCDRSFVFAMEGCLGAADELELTVGDGRLTLRAGGVLLARPCVWDDEVGPPPELPLDARLEDKLRVSRTRTLGELRRMGVERLVTDAEAELRSCVEEAARALAPLGIQPAEVATFVDQTLAKRWPRDAP